MIAAQESPAARIIGAIGVGIFNLVWWTFLAALAVGFFGGALYLVVKAVKFAWYL